MKRRPAGFRILILDPLALGSILETLGSNLQPLKQTQTLLRHPQEFHPRRVVTPWFRSWEVFKGYSSQALTQEREQRVAIKVQWFSKLVLVASFRGFPRQCGEQEGTERARKGAGRMKAGALQKSGCARAGGGGRRWPGPGEG